MIASANAVAAIGHTQLVKLSPMTDSASPARGHRPAMIPVQLTPSLFDKRVSIPSSVRLAHEPPDRGQVVVLDLDLDEVAPELEGA